MNIVKLLLQRPAFFHPRLTILRSYCNDFNAQEYLKLSTAIQASFVKNLCQKINLVDGNTCLDLGCGTGNGTVIIAESVGEKGRVIACDPDQTRLKLALENYSRENINYIQGTIFDLKLPDSSIDGAIANAVLHWIPTDQRLATFEEVYRILKPNTCFIFTAAFQLSEVANKMLEFYQGEKKKKLLDKIYLGNEELYRKMAFESGFEMEMEISIIERSFPTDETSMKFLDASLYTDFISTYLEHKDKLTFRRTEDGKILDSLPFGQITFKKQ